MPELRFITFGGGSKEFHHAARRLAEQARQFELFDSIISYTETDLEKSFFTTFHAIDFKVSRGFGFWAWKPYIIEKNIRELEDGDILIYLDSGAELNIRGKNRFIEYLEIVSRNGTVFFSMPYFHRQFCKNDKRLALSDDFYFRNQISAAFIMLKVGAGTRKFVDDWLSLASIDGGALLTDSNNLDGEPLDFIDHRHDQALLTVVALRSGMEPLAPDETYFDPWNLGRNFPVLLLRNRTGDWIVNYKIAKGLEKLKYKLLMPVLLPKYFIDLSTISTEQVEGAL